MTDGYNLEDASTHTGMALRVVTSDELLKMDIPPRRYAVEPVLPLPGLVMLYGPRGMGKTFVSLSLAIAVASGGAVLKWRVPEARRVLYIDGEMPAVMIKERLALLLLGAGKTPDADFLRFMCADILPNGMPSITRPEVQRAIEAALTDVDVVIFDNLSTLAEGLRENEADDWGELQRWFLSLRRAGKTVVLIHHAGKGGQQRGTSRREDVLDTVIALRRPTDYDTEEGARFEVHLEKARGIVGAAAAPFEARLVEPADAGLTWTFADLTTAQRDRAEALLREGMTVREVAEATGMSKSAVGRLNARPRPAGQHGRA
jgi:putative DNA primase/helicase